MFQSFSEHSILSLYTIKYSTSLSNYEQFTLLSDKPENLTPSLDSFDYSNSSHLNPIQNAKKHKSVFITSSNKKPKSKKSWVWDHMRKDKHVKKETICLVLVKQNGKVEKCEETFALLTSTSTLDAHL
ncbi:11780_t:CDS:1, partial [Cetraspora pellucida]